MEPLSGHESMDAMMGPTVELHLRNDLLDAAVGHSGEAGSGKNTEAPLSGNDPLCATMGLRIGPAIQPTMGLTMEPLPS